MNLTMSQSVLRLSSGLAGRDRDGTPTSGSLSRCARISIVLTLHTPGKKIDLSVIFLDQTIWNNDPYIYRVGLVYRVRRHRNLKERRIVSIDQE